MSLYWGHYYGVVAFYIRRSFRGNALYTAVLREYMHTLITRNTPIEYFIEGVARAQDACYRLKWVC